LRIRAKKKNGLGAGKQNRGKDGRVHGKESLDLRLSKREGKKTQ